MAEVRHALARDAQGAVDALVRGFADDPLFAWMCPDPERRPEFLKRFLEPCFRSGLSRGNTYVLSDWGGAALWGPPDVAYFDEADLLALIEAMAFGAGHRVDDVGGPLTELTELHPSEPHFYLDTLALDPGHRGKGLGGPLIAPILQTCDREGLPAYLESSNPRNLSFYERHGFEVRHHLDMPDGPRVHTMWREPGSVVS